MSRWLGFVSGFHPGFFRCHRLKVAEGGVEVVEEMWGAVEWRAVVRRGECGEGCGDCRIKKEPPVGGCFLM